MVSVIIVCLLMSIFAVGCQFEENTYKTMYSLNETYVAAMESVNDFRKKGIMTQDQVNKALILGNQYYESFELASDVFKVYLENKSVEDKDKLTALLGELPGLLFKLEKYVSIFEREKP